MGIAEWIVNPGTMTEKENSKEDLGQIKICDFGSAKVIDMSPEA